MCRLFSRTFIIVIFFGIVYTSCKKSANNLPSTGITMIDNFDAGTDNWVGDFADYPNDPISLPLYQLQFLYSSLPLPLNTGDGAILQAGINRSDDLFMFIKKKVTGLTPDKNYTVDLKVDFATNAASNMVGVGGAPGEGVKIKAGAVSVEPTRVLNTTENWYRMNIDKGNQSIGGIDMKIIGDFTNGTDQNVYKIKQLTTTSPLNVKANQQGEIWLVIGTDSGFEGLTKIYYNSIHVVIK